MAGIIDSLVAHLEARIVYGDSSERVSVDVFNEFMRDFESSTPVNVSQVTFNEKIQVETLPVQVPEKEEKSLEEQFVPSAIPAQLIPKKELVTAEDITSLNLQELRVQGNTCSACKLALGEQRSKNTAVNESARLMIISEPSGRTDEHMIDLFHGDAGELLWKMVSAMKIKMDDLYMCMAHKCVGPGAREKIVESKPFLERQIELVKPEVILIFGGAALNILLGEQSLMKNRGQWLDVKGIPTMATFPPAYLQQKAEAKREAWNDMQQVMARLEL